MGAGHNLDTSAAGVVVSAGAVSRAALASVPEAPLTKSAATQPPPSPPTGRPYQPVVTLNGWSLPWRMQDGIKEFHLIAEPVAREIAQAQYFLITEHRLQTLPMKMINQF